MTLTDNEMVELEKLIDNHGLHIILDGLMEICHDKADHIHANWEDKQLAALWRRSAKAIDKARVAMIV